MESKKEFDKRSEVFKILSNPVRQQIMKIVKDTPTDIPNLVKLLDEPYPAALAQLRILQLAGWVNTEKSNRTKIISSAKDSNALEEIFKLAKLLETR